MTFKERLIELRKEKNLTQKQVADDLGMQVPTYGRYEIGLREPNMEMLDKLARYFNVTVDYLMGRTDRRD